MKSLKTLWRVAANDLAARCCTSALRDYQTVTERVEHEGMSFLTITLPAFGKEFERTLDLEQVAPSDFPGFHSGNRGPLPSFLGGFLEQVFDRHTGRLLDVPSEDCIFAVRQLTLMFGKILLPCSEERTADAFAQYIKCEKEVAEAAELGAPEVYKDFERIAALLWTDVFTELENQLYEGTLIPRHGPGATADRLRGNSKFDQREWPLRLESVFSFLDYALPNPRYHTELDHVNFLEPGAERPVKVIAVPKTLKTPRIIAVEPTCMQYMQQAISNKCVGLMEQAKIGENRRSNLVHGQVGFTDQMPNRHLAQRGSLKGDLATLDLSEASDRVSIRHVRSLFHRWPLLQEAVDATRSRKAEVPGWGEVSLTKFASMGSALTFPIEAAVFLTAVYMGIERALSRQIDRSDVMSLRGEVRVYGDDIIVPVGSVHSVISVLEDLGFRVNQSKSFWNGKFRESCGGDYYNGVDVTPVRVRRTFPRSRADGQEVISLVATRNQFYSAGLWQTARYLDGILGKMLTHYPTVSSDSPLLGRITFLPLETEEGRWSSDRHVHLVRGYVPVSKPPPSPVSGVGALLKVLSKQGVEPFADVKHLERQGRPQTVDIKLRWMPPYSYGGEWLPTTSEA